MIDEQINQKAEEYVKKHEIILNCHHDDLETDFEDKKKAYIAGSNSRNSEIEALKIKNKTLKETLLTREAEIADMEVLRKYDKELLNNAVSLLKDIYKNDNYFCDKLLEIPKEEKICEIYCDKEGVQCDCILRYLKYYKNKNKILTSIF